MGRGQLFNFTQNPDADGISSFKQLVQRTDDLTTLQVPTVVSVLGQILEATLLNPDSAIVDASTAQRMGRLLQGMQVLLYCY